MLHNLVFKKLKFSLFSDNSTIPFMEMTKTLGSAIIVIPLIAILESVAIAKAFGKHFISTIYNSFYIHFSYLSVCLQPINVKTTQPTRSQVWMEIFMTQWMEGQWIAKLFLGKIIFFIHQRNKSAKGIEILPQTQIFWSQFLCNLMVQTFDISNLYYFIYKYE